MKKDDVYDIVKKNISEILPGVDMDDDISFRDLGGNSIDYVEIITGVHDDLELDVSLTEMGKAKTINALVDLCYGSMEDSEDNEKIDEDKERDK